MLVRILSLPKMLKHHISLNGEISTLTTHFSILLVESHVGIKDLRFGSNIDRKSRQSRTKRALTFWREIRPIDQIS